jgi:DNA mismatch endonuclease (patch repair protein)
MAAIRAKNTVPELKLRRALHKLGFRYRLHVKELPGKPDIVLPRYGAVVFMHSCLFHKHLCRTFRWPQTRPHFWRTKIEGNAARDRRTEALLLRSGWRVGVVWECRLRGRGSKSLDEVSTLVARWLRSGRRRFEL